MRAHPPNYRLKLCWRYTQIAHWVGKHALTRRRCSMLLDTKYFLPGGIYVINKTSATPPISPLPPPFTGVYFRLSDAIKYTTVRILYAIKPPKELKMKMKFGFDDSGSHPIFKQRNNSDTNNIILTMFCPLQLEDSNGNVR